MSSKVYKGSESTNTLLKKQSRHTTLDTLEVTSDYYKSKSHESLYRSALRKSRTLSTLKRLIDVSDSKQQKKYWKTYHCKREMLQDGKIFISRLCRKRWCTHCSRIKTAEYINAYHEPLKTLQGVEDLYFVTLTCPTVEERKLKAEIQKRYDGFTRIKDNLRKNYGIKLCGIRALEVTFTKDKKYHPHFHLIIQGEKAAHLVHDLWLNRFKSARDKGQDIQLIDPTDPRNLKETFKYAAKVEVEDRESAHALNTIYLALEGRRTIQTFGKIRKSPKPIKAKQENESADFVDERQEIWIYNPIEKDYLNAFGERLINTRYIEDLQSITNKASEHH